ncbi:MAG: DUF11 domain-containing protein [Chloroflexales bacterium]|nr:DUF11 domain-containing protein [Chloroflexales bacterium]
MKHIFSLALAVLGLGLLSASPLAAQAQTTPPVQGLTLFTRYPTQEIAIGDALAFPLVLRADSAQTVKLNVRDLPKGWTATLRGDGKVIQAAYVNPGEDTAVDLRLDPPKDLQAGDYHFSVAADGASAVNLPLEVIVQQKLPPSLEFAADLPTIRGAPDSDFRFNTTLRNQGDSDVTVNLIAQAPDGFEVSFNSAGQDVTSLPVEANSTKNITVQAHAPADAQAGSFPIYITAEGGDLSAKIALTAEVVGQSQIALTTPDGRLSGDATIGQSTAFTLVVRNTGTAPAKEIKLSAAPPTGWSVTFTPATIAELPAGQELQVSANLRPADQAVAGDYVVSLSAKPAEGRSATTDFRVTVLTSTLWGIAGIALIAVAVAVVGLAVSRFGRR